MDIEIVSDSEYQARIGTVMLGCVLLIFSVVGIIPVKRMKRTSLFISSLAGMGICLFSFAYFVD